MNKYIVLSHSTFPFYEKLRIKSESFQIIDVDHSSNLYQDLKNVVESTNFESHILDLTVLATDTKRQIYHFISNLFQTNKKNLPQIFSDLSFCWGELLYEEFSNLQAAFALSFYSPTGIYEVAVKNQTDTDEVEKIFEVFGVKSCYVQTPGLGFTLPRVFGQIINEAYFSKQEHLATKEDIDTAMKFGVNYPLGPFEWSRKVSLRGVCLLLDELTQVTGDPRYRASKLLRKEALLNQS